MFKPDQDNHRIAEPALRILAHTGCEADLALIWVPGCAPMRKRMDVYNRVIDNHPGLREVNRFGAVTGLDTEITMKSVPQSHPDGTIDVIWATWDEFAKGSARAIMHQGRKEVRLYGVDISNTDLQMLQNPENPWVATVEGDPKVCLKQLCYSI